jgi:hypothetical protein
MLIEYDPQERGWIVNSLALVHLARIRKQYRINFGPHFVDDVLTVLECSHCLSDEERELRQALEAIPRLKHAAFIRALREKDRKN